MDRSGCLLVPWRRLGRSLCWSVLGCVSFVMLVVLGLASHYTADQLCHYECSIEKWLDPVGPLDAIFIDHIIEEVIQPQQETVVHPLTEEEVRSPLARDPFLYATNQFLREYVRGAANGTFVVVGSGDGVFLSFTAQLEVLNNWRGLLVEPRPEAYRSSRRRRRAAAANVCVTAGEHHRKEVFWTPRLDGEDMTPLLKKFAGARSMPKRYVSEEDLADGTEQIVQCFTLDALVTAYQRSLGKPREPIDLLLLDTNFGEIQILEGVMNSKYKIIVMPVRDNMELASAIAITQQLNLSQVSEATTNFNFAIFVHNSIKIIR